ncbi:MAG: hypothetical protein QXI41_01020 [Candidatus Pacearchaeota archaeon]
MVKRINILYLLDKTYFFCPHFSHTTEKEGDIKFSNIEELKEYLKELAVVLKKRKIEIALDKDIPKDNREDLEKLIKENFDKVKIIDYH